MSIKTECRCIVQRTDSAKNKYYPKPISARITTTFPWSVPVASIEINTRISHDNSIYMPPIRLDDIVRFQVNVTQTPTEPSVWVELFSGRLMKVSGSIHARGGSTTLIARGFSEELLYRAITSDYSASSTRTGAMIATLVSSYLSRLTDTNLIDTTASTIIPEYNIKQDTKYMSDMIKELESLEAYGYILDIITRYDSDNNLDSNIVSWQPVPSLSKTIKIIERTPRLNSANFDKSIENVVEDVTIYGAHGSPQKVGVSVDGNPEYGTRHHIGTDLSISTNQLCQDLAIATRSRFGAGITSGYCNIIGDPTISVGDLVYVNMRSMVLDGNIIDGNYRVKRLTHNITNNANWTSTVGLGELIQSPSDILNGMHTKNRLTAANFIE